jgi:glucose-6-phosphate dehydrogenase assembly protein OpcA
VVTPPRQIHVPKTLDVEAVEQALSELWHKTTHDPDEYEGAVMRARAANLMVFLTREQALQETQQTINELAVIHPCRALVMLADYEGPDRDIELFVSAFCQEERRTKKVELCCEEVTLIARGNFTAELPSAATPFLVPDLPVFLWLQDLQRLDDSTFQSLTRASERLVIDSVDLPPGSFDLNAFIKFFTRQGSEAIAVSDINWSRLTSWRGLLASFYDVAEYRSALANLERVKIEYVSPAGNPNGVAMQAVLIAGWLASRLNWTIVAEGTEKDRSSYRASRPDGGDLILELQRVEHPEMKPGRLAKVELQTEGAIFTVRRADDGFHLETEATLEGRLCPGRTLPVRNRSTAHLLSREMEILRRDVPYEDAVRVAATLVQ